MRVLAILAFFRSTAKQMQTMVGRCGGGRQGYSPSSRASIHSIASRGFGKREDG